MSGWYLHNERVSIIHSIKDFTSSVKGFEPSVCAVNYRNRDLCNIVIGTVHGIGQRDIESNIHSNTILSRIITNQWFFEGICFDDGSIFTKKSPMKQNGNFVIQINKCTQRVKYGIRSDAIVGTPFSC